MARGGKLRCVEDPRILELSEGFKILSDPNRLRIVCYLLRGERCVCEVERELDISQQLASHHLNVLKEGGFLKMRKEGTSSFYWVAEDKLDRIMEVFSQYLGYRGGLRIETGEMCCTPGTSSQNSKGRARRGWQPKEVRFDEKDRHNAGR